MSNYAVQDDKSLVETYSKEEIDKKIQDGSLIGEKVIKSASIFPLAVKNEHLAEGSVALDNMQDGSVNTSKLVDKSVTFEKLSEDAVKVTGTYTGDGRLLHISLGFTPSYLKIMTAVSERDHQLCIWVDVMNGMETGYFFEEVDGEENSYPIWSGSSKTIEDGGFGVMNDLNMEGIIYSFIAFR